MARLIPAAQRGAGARSGQTWTAVTVPFPAAENVSSQVAWRVIAPSPMPSVPAVE
jgi:hypothetical protein